MKMVITLVPHGIFGSNFVYLCILTLSSHWYEKKCDEASPSIIFDGRALLVKMLITLEPHGIFGSCTAWYIWFLYRMVYLVQILYTCVF